MRTFGPAIRIYTLEDGTEVRTSSLEGRGLEPHRRDGDRLLRLAAEAYEE